jgi:cysteine synthase A
MREVSTNIAQQVGGTPVVQLTRIAAGLPAELFGKLESLNPGGSVKDRVGRVRAEASESGR